MHKCENIRLSGGQPSPHEEKVSRGVTEDRIHGLKNDILTCWNYRLCAMLKHISKYNNVDKVIKKLAIVEGTVPSMNEVQKEAFDEMIPVISEICRDYLQLEAHHKSKMSRASRFLHELYEMLLILSCAVNVTTDRYYKTETALLSAVADEDSQGSQLIFQAIPSIG